MFDVEEQVSSIEEGILYLYECHNEVMGDTSQWIWKGRKRMCVPLSPMIV